MDGEVNPGDHPAIGDVFGNPEITHNPSLGVVGQLVDPSSGVRVPSGGDEGFAGIKRSGWVGHVKKSLI
jgi:hypothetical protein